MAELFIKRWRNNGKDRLYLTGATGETCAWHDLGTGETFVFAFNRAETAIRAIRGWRSASGLDAPRPTAVGGEHEDLALRPAGAAARAEAIRLRQEAPKKSFLGRFFDVRSEERSWRIGAEGEERVAARLEQLRRADPRWRVLHSIPVGNRGSDIDHVVIGLPGVFTLNTKHHPRGRVWVGHDALMVNGHKQPYLRNSRFEASRAAKLLSAATGIYVPVVPAIVLVGVASVRVAGTPDGVAVLDERQLTRWLAEYPRVFDHAAVDRVFEAARRPATWRS